MRLQGLAAIVYCSFQTNAEASEKRNFFSIKSRVIYYTKHPYLNEHIFIYVVKVVYKEGLKKNSEQKMDATKETFQGMIQVGEGTKPNPPRFPFVFPAFNKAMFFLDKDMDYSGIDGRVSKTINSCFLVRRTWRHPANTLNNFVIFIFLMLPVCK